MSNKEFAKSLIDKIPESKMFYIISYLQGAAVPDEIPNAETMEAILEVDNMVMNGAGERFAGTTDDFFASIAEETMNFI